MLLHAVNILEKGKMVKLNATLLKYMSREDFRVLTAVSSNMDESRVLN